MRPRARTNARPSPTKSSGDSGNAGVRGAVASLYEGGCRDEVVRPVVMRAFSDAIIDQFSPERVVGALTLASRHRRPTYPLPDFVTSPRVGHHANVGPVVEDPRRVEAIWCIDEIAEELTEMRRSLIDEVGEPNSEGIVDLAQRLGQVLRGARTVLPNSLLRARRTCVLNTVAVVVDLRLPAVLRRLAEQGVLRKDLLEDYFQPLVAEDHECVVGIVRARYPWVADELEEVEAEHRELLRRWRDPSAGTKWQAALDLFNAMRLWEVPEKSPRRSRKASREGAVTKGSDADELESGNKQAAAADSVRATHQSKDNPEYIGDLRGLKGQVKVWGRVRAYLSAMGLGDVSVRLFAETLTGINVPA